MERNDLAGLSAKYGSTTDWVQAAGGNTSVKLEGMLLIKKSGIRLRDVSADEGYLPVSVSREEIANLCEDKTNDIETYYARYIDSKIAKDQARPSIELSFHAIGKKYVVHTHATLVNVFTCSVEGQEWIRTHLPGVALLPYVKPGIKLTRKILELFHTLPDVSMLCSHGLIISSDTPDGVDLLTTQLWKALEKEVVLEPIAEETEMGEAALLSPSFPGMQVKCISDAFTREYTPETGIMFPDYAVYCGATVYAFHEDMLGKAWSSTKEIPKIIKFREQYYALASTEAALCFTEEVFRNHARVQYHIRKKGWTPEALNEAQVMELLNWDLEKYRQQLIQ